MSHPLKKAGYSQGLYSQSSSKKEEIGTKRFTQDGRTFEYARNGATALAAGKLTSVVAPAANVINEASPNAVAVGKTVVEFTAGAAVTYAEDYFAGGMLNVNDAAGEGHQYLIEGSSAVTAGTQIFISLRDPIRVALTTASELTLIHNHQMGVILHATTTNPVAGIPPIAVTANYYFWNQVKGQAICLTAGTPAIGSFVVPSTTDGAVAIMSTTFAVGLSMVGVMIETGVDTEYCAIRLGLMSGG
jgi:hypothetical protein